ncbi:hypothetical protein ACWGQ2_14560 [Arthrobacter sp. NPDC055585]
MSSVRPEENGSTKKRSSRIIAIAVAVVALAFAAAALFVALRPDGSAAEKAEAIPTPSAAQAEDTPEPGQPAETPAASAEPETPPVPEYVSYTTSDGMLQFDHPAGWTVRPLFSPAKDVHPQALEAVEVINADGQTMGELITGVVTGFVALPGVPYIEFDYEPIAGLEDKEPGRGEAPAFVFHGLDQAAGFEADMAVTGWGRQAAPQSAVLPHGFEYIPGTSGAFFNRPLSTQTILPVDPALTGAPRLQAYMQTEEYQDVKAMMMSLRFLR